ncbi:MAG: hypothetical protein PVI86_03840 [Phycisphaerae bacterium]|jgi:hypothetical protein
MMRMERVCCGAVALVFGCLAAVPVWSADPDSVGTMKSDAEVAPESGAEAAVETWPEMALALDEDVTCVEIGAWEDVRPSLGSGRFRGNIYRIPEDPDGSAAATILREAKMELLISNGVEVTLVFSFHRAEIEEGLRTFNRFDVPDRSLAVVGTGFPEIYSPGPLPVPLLLEPGWDYLIGVSWLSSSVSFGRDVRTYPRTYLHGEILGLASQNVGPPLPDEFGPLTAFTGGAYSMELCFDSVVGACCTLDELGEAACAEMLESDCMLDPDSPGNFFHGERVECPEVFCQVGTCCFPCGDCAVDYTPETCRLEDGTWAGRGALCDAEDPSAPNACEIVYGACCDGATCTELCVDECDQAGGVYQGHGTTCHPNFCAGACCVPDVGCADLTREVCELVAGLGAYRGAGTSCDALPTDPNADECGGACCYELLGTPRCLEVEQRSECTTAQGLTNPFYMGDAFSCDEVEDICADPDTTTIDLEGCCLPDGACTVADTEVCEDVLRGVPTGTAGCVACDITCCTDNGCRMMPDDTTCVDPSYVPLAGATCLDAPCRPTGACCKFAGGYIDGLTADQCEAERGRLEASPAVCDLLPDLGACCRPNGTCADLVTLTECTESLGGHADGHFPGSYCDDTGIDCPEFGACCNTLGSCFVVHPDDCIEDGWTFAGDGTECTDNTCRTGACCIDEECTKPELTRAGCEAFENSTYRGDGTACDDGTVFCSEIEGACCLPTTGACARMTEQECYDEEGEFEGIEVGCRPGLCTLGACCHLDGTCDSEVIEVACVGDHDRFLPGAVCAACPRVGACCLPAGGCLEDVREFECENPFGHDGVYVGDGTSCTADLCALGACCLADETCAPSMTRQACESLEVPGVYQGEGSSCTPGLCLFGLCCHLDGTCDDGLVESQCTDAFDEFAAGFECRDFFCRAGGACCTIDGECVEGVTEVDCTAGGGTYSGDGVRCLPDLCVTGACCTEDGECGMLTRQDCEKDNGLYLGEDRECDGTEDCTRGSCCSAAGVCEDNKVRELCETEGDFREESCAVQPCRGRGACCFRGDPGTCESYTRLECVSQTGIYSGSATECDSDLCVEGACCELDGTCEQKTRQRCERAYGYYHGAGVACGGADCALFITVSDPPDCTVDPRQPYGLDGSAEDDRASFTMTFNRPAGLVRSDDFSVEVFPESETVPVIEAVELNGAVATLTFDQILPPQRWTCVTHNFSGDRFCWGALPADVDGSRKSETSDLQPLVDHLGGSGSLELWRCDINRSGRCTGADLLRAIDLLNGGDVYEPGWNDAMFLDELNCPNEPPKTTKGRVIRGE